MTKRVLLLMAGAVFGVLLLATPAAAQDNSDGSGTGTVDTVDAVQVMPVVVDVALPVDGEVVTTSVPYSAEVWVQVRLVPANAAASVPLSLTVDDAASLLPALSEMPTGFYESMAAQPLSTNTDVAAQYANADEVLAQVQAFDRLGGMMVQYNSSQYSVFIGGNGTIGISAMVMGSPEGAQGYMESYMDREVQSKDKPDAVYLVSAPQLGDRSRLFKRDLSYDDNQISEYELWVQRGNTLLTISSRGLRDMGDVDQLIALARRVLARGLDRPAEPEPLAIVVAPPAEAQAEATPAPVATTAIPAVVEVQPATPEPVNAATADPLSSLPHLTATMTEPIDIGGYQVQIDAVDLYDLAQLKAADTEHADLYESDQLEGVQVLGVLQATLTNGSDQDLALPSSDVVVVVGSEQQDLADYRYVGDETLDDTLLPGVRKQVTVYFGLKDTAFAQLQDGASFRLQMPGPITADYQAVVKDAKYQVALELTPAP